jgi:hypothetical protein
VDTATAMTLRANNPNLQAIKFLWNDYLPQYYFFEVVETLRRMMLTGIPVIIQGSDQLGWRRVLALFTSVVFLVLYRETSPYQWTETNALSNVCQLQIFLTLFICFLLSLEEFGSSSIDGFQFYGKLLLLLNVVTILMTVWIQSKQYREEAHKVRDRPFPLRLLLLCGSERI